MLSKTFFRRNTDVFKEKCRSTARKGPLSGCVGSFQIHPRSGVHPLRDDKDHIRNCSEHRQTLNFTVARKKI